MSGQLSVLNCGAGDLKFSFASDNPIEVERAREVVGDMLKRGYALFVVVDGQTRKVTEFDPARDEYVIGSWPIAPTETLAEPLPTADADKQSPVPAEEPARPRGRGRRVSAKSVSATAVAPTAGG